MNIFLDGVEIDKKLIWFNDGLNYGRFHDTPYKKYELQLSRSEIMKVLESEYNEVRDDIREDDILSNDSSEFKIANYCSFSTLMNQSSHFEDIMKGYLDIPLFTKLFEYTRNCKFIINSTDSVVVEKNKVIFHGRVFSLSPPYSKQHYNKNKTE